MNKNNENLSDSKRSSIFGTTSKIEPPNGIIEIHPFVHTLVAGLPFGFLQIGLGQEFRVYKCLSHRTVENILAADKSSWFRFVFELDRLSLAVDKEIVGMFLDVK